MTFGASDAPLPGKELDEVGLAQFPMVMGGIVPVVNLDGIKPGELDDRRPDARQDLHRRHQDLGRSGDQEAQSERQAAEPGDRRRASFGRLGHHLQLRLLPGGRERGLEVEGRLQHLGAVAGRHRRQGQRRRRQQRRQHQGFDRLRRVRLCAAEQADLHQDGQQGRQDRGADLGSVPGRGGQCQLEVAARLRRDPRQPARRQVVADDGGDLDPGLQAAGRCGRHRRGAQVLRLGLQERRQDGREPRLRADAGQRGHGHREVLEGEIKDASGKPVF